jgi:hypothetical protein
MRCPDWRRHIARGDHGFSRQDRPRKIQPPRICAAVIGRPAAAIEAQRDDIEEGGASRRVDPFEERQVVLLPRGRQRIELRQQNHGVGIRPARGIRPDSEERDVARGVRRGATPMAGHVR